RQGLDVSLDQFEESPGWAEWAERRLLDSDFVLSVCTPLYLKRFQNPSKGGRGVGWEADVIRQQLYNRSGLPEFIPILMKGGVFEDIPLILQKLTFYRVDSRQDYARLLLRLKGRRK